MKTNAIFRTTIVAVPILLMTACAAGSPAHVTDANHQSSSGSSPTLTTESSTLGTIVVDGKSRTVYQFDKDTQGGTESACAGDCAKNWPSVPGSAGKNLEGITGKIGSITGTSGSPQLTINGWPLYYFAGDESSGDAKGQAVGDVWWVVSPTGEPIRDKRNRPETAPASPKDTKQPDADTTSAQELEKELHRVGPEKFTASKYRPATIEHVVLFKYRPGTSEAVKDEIASRFRALATESKRDGKPYIRSLVDGVQNSGEKAGKGLEHGFIVTFNSEGDRNFYVGDPIVSDSKYFDPKHDAFKKFAGPHIEDIEVFDFRAG